MLHLLQENLATILVGLAMLLLVGLALWGALAPRRPSGSGRRPGHDRHACKAARNPLQ